MKHLIRFDWAIKRLLRNKANYVILEGFLSELLGDDIKIDSILESESNKQASDSKTNRVDILVQNKNGELLIIEFQNNFQSDYLLRMLFGTSKLLVDNMDEGLTYSMIKKIISINIVYFDLGQGEDYIYHGTTNYVGMHTGDILNLSFREKIYYPTDRISKIYPEYYIIKVNKFDQIAVTPLEEWINFLKKEEVNKNTMAKGLKEAKAKIETLKKNKDEMREYEWYIQNERDFLSQQYSNFLEGERKGREEGIKENKIEIALKCIQKGMFLSDIVELTGLPEDEIRSLKV